MLYQSTPSTQRADLSSPDNGYPCPSSVAIYSNVALSTVINQPVSIEPHRGRRQSQPIGL